MNIESIFNSLLNFISYGWKPLIEISIIASIFYTIYLFIEGTRTIQVVKGLLILFAIYMLSSLFNFPTINWLLKNIFAVLAIALIIIFQPEFRKGLAEIGRKPFLSSFHYEEASMAPILSNAVFALAEKKIGALIAIERFTGLKNYIDTGIIIDSRLSVELIQTLFMPRTPLHDGGVIIDGIRIAAAGCLFPLSQRPDISRSLGTRHRAAIGLTEETDALVIVVSEETGGVSIASRGKLSRNIEEETLAKIISRIYENQQKKQTKKSLFINKIFKRQ
ncbi:MAG: diadenylate cyclase CdaA [Candidatus Aureabacteria bacterium]|nr:diadenylate cyclase CdaA [Candidatus Auribacterota bacterium]